MTKVTFFTKDECALCSAAWYVVERVRRRIPFVLERIDITAPGQAHWHELYADHIPVIHVDGQEAFRHRVDERQLREMLQAAELD